MWERYVRKFIWDILKTLSFSRNILAIANPNPKQNPSGYLRDGFLLLLSYRNNSLACLRLAALAWLFRHRVLETAKQGVRKKINANFPQTCML